MKILNKIKELFAINNQRGVVLPIILMAIGGLSLIGAAAIGVSTGEIGIANNDRNYKAALNMAEAGVADAADGIQANRDLLPRPLGAINSASYSFNVALGNTGRYSVSVSLPVVTTTAADILIGASTAVVTDTTGLNVGDTIVIGDTTTHIMTRIGAIDRTAKILTLMDNKNNPYYFGQNLGTGTYVARNKLQITSTGYAGLGLVGQYSTVGGWRTVSAINGTPNPTLSTAGALRSTATLQGDYSMQEVAMFGSFDARVDAGGNKFFGPIFVTNSLSLSPYNRGDYSGPIFAPTTVINAGNIKIGNPTASSYYPSTAPNANYPKVIGVSPAAVTKANISGALAQAAASSTCYQVQCSNASATQQIYYLNGYEIGVSLKTNITGNNPSITASNPIVNTTTNTLRLTLTVNSATPLANGVGSHFQVYIESNPTTEPTMQPALPGWNYGTGGTSGFNVVSTISSIVSTTAGVTGNASIISGNAIDLSGATSGTVTFDIPLPSGTGFYLTIGANGSQGTNSGLTNALLVGTAYSAYEKQGNITVGTHTGHTTILTTQPAITTTGSTYNGHAALFGGKTMTSSGWTVGMQSEYLTRYYIHTTAPGSCNDQDIVVTSKTSVTYLGTGTKCSSSELRKLFLFETVWNHTTTNGLNSGYQADSTIQPQKGYYKFVRGKDNTENEPIIVSMVIGDKEFNSVFNHAAKPAFTSSVVNVNIGGGDDRGAINMIGYANPPLKWNNLTNQMDIYTKDFTASSPVYALPTSPNNWDQPDMVGPYTDFVVTPSTNGFDFVDMSLASKSIVPYTVGNNEILPDVSTIPGSIAGGNIPTYRNSTTGVYPGSWSFDSNRAAPNATAGAPIMDTSGLPTTTITATISGPYFSWFTIQRGTANLFFNPANGIAFNVAGLKVETKGSGANITIGSTANPATVFAGQVKMESEDCGGTTNFNFVGKMVASQVEFENNVKYNMDTTLSGANTCLSPALQSFIYLKKEGWKEIR